MVNHGLQAVERMRGRKSQSAPAVLVDVVAQDTDLWEEKESESFDTSHKMKVGCALRRYRSTTKTQTHTQFGHSVLLG